MSHQRRYVIMKNENLLHHSTAPQGSDPLASHRASPASFGVTSAHPAETRERRRAMKKIICSLDPKAREWCRLCLEEEVDPVDAYKQLGIDKNFLTFTLSCPLIYAREYDTIRVV